MRDKFKDKSVAVISLSVDAAEREGDARRFLTKIARIKPAFPGFILNEDVETGMKHLGIQTEPAFVIFDHAGKRIASFDFTQLDPREEDLFSAVEKKVDALLRK